MDPKACLDRLIEELRTGYDVNAIGAAGDLLVWLLAGGALPDDRPLHPEQINTLRDLFARWQVRDAFREARARVDP